MMSKSQDKFIFCTKNDAMYINMQHSPVEEFDLDEMTKIGSIKAVTSDDNHFYILANKWNEKLGYYLLKIN